MSKKKSKLRRQVEVETGKQFRCAYEFYRYQDGKKTFCDRIDNASHEEATEHLNKLYKEHNHAAFVMEIKTLDFRDLALAPA